MPHATASPDQEQHRHSQNVGEIPQEDEGSLAPKGGPGESHGMEQRQHLRNPEPAFRQALVQWKEDVREKEERGQEQGEVKAEEIDVRDTQRERDPNRSKE